MDAREVALEVLTSCRKAEAWADGALRGAIRRAGLDTRDGALAGCSPEELFARMKNSALYNIVARERSRTDEVVKVEITG